MEAGVMMDWRDLYEHGRPGTPLPECQRAAWPTGFTVEDREARLAVLKQQHERVAACSRGLGILFFVAVAVYIFFAAQRPVDTAPWNEDNDDYHPGSAACKYNGDCGG
jgi:hypothetical protein